VYANLSRNDPSLKNKRGLLKALRTNPDNLTLNKQQQRDDYLKQQPAIATIYVFKRRLHRLLMRKTLKAKHCKKLIPVLLYMIKQLKQSSFKRLAKLVKLWITGKRKW